MVEHSGLRSGRLALRIPDAGDAERMLRYAVDNRAHLAPWDPVRGREYFTLEFWQRELRALANQAAQDEHYRFILLFRDDLDGPVQGQCSVSNIVRGPFQAAVLGYALDYRAVGKGLMREALAAVIDFCFEELKLHRLMANYMPENDRSARLLESLGFEIEGRARDYLYLAGKWQDHVLTSLINDEWRTG